MRPLRLSEYQFMWLIVLTVCLLFSKPVEATKRGDFITAHHQINAAVAWVVYQPMKVLPLKGPLSIKPMPGHSYLFSLGYNYWHNNNLGIHIGTGFSEVSYRYSYTLEKDKQPHPFSESVYTEQHSERDLFMLTEVTAIFNLPIKNRFSLFFEPGVQLNAHPRSIIEIIHGMDNLDTQASYRWGYCTIYRNVEGVLVYPSIVLNLGGYVSFKHGDLLGLKVIVNIQGEDIVSGQYEFYNLGASNNSYGKLKMNTSYWGMAVTYNLSMVRRKKG
jgi:hypothetical protein